MDIDVQDILIGGFSALLLVVFLVQTLRETFNIASRYLPAVGLGVSVILMMLAAYLPEKMVTALAAAIAVAAATSFAVRYVKNGEQPHEYPSGIPVGSLQGYDPDTLRVSRPVREGTKTS